MVLGLGPCCCLWLCVCVLVGFWEHMGQGKHASKQGGVNGPVFECVRLFNLCLSTQVGSPHPTHTIARPTILPSPKNVHTPNPTTNFKSNTHTHTHTRHALTKPTNQPPTPTAVAGVGDRGGGEGQDADQVPKDRGPRDQLLHQPPAHLQLPRAGPFWWFGGFGGGVESSRLCFCCLVLSCLGGWSIRSGVGVLGLRGGGGGLIFGCLIEWLVWCIRRSIDAGNPASPVSFSSSRSSSSFNLTHTPHTHPNKYNSHTPPS
jgi:hypothetical protein